MSSVVKQMFAVLIVVGVISGMVLAGTEQFTRPLIEEHKLEELQESIFVVVPEAKTYEEIGTGEFKAFKGLNENNEVAGYAFIAEGPGFQGNIRMIVGIDSGLDTLFGMRVLEQVETPGLGAKISENTDKKDFFEQFAGLQPDWEELQAALTYVKNAVPDEPNEIQAITGATISSAAVVDIINQYLVKLRQVVESKQ